VQNLTDRAVRYTPGDRGGASSKHKQDIKNKKAALQIKSRFGKFVMIKTRGEG
jgi:phosphatidylserine decarboxylase